MSGIRKKIVFLPYDFDTSLGIDNYGRLVFGYELEDIDQTSGGEEVYSGQSSVLWKNVRAAFHNELTTMYRELRSGNDPALSYEKIERMFEEHQSKWPEALFNEDARYKYILPFTEDNEDRLAMCLGSKTEQRKWWLYNRFKYIDSKYNAGSAADDSVSFRGFALPEADTHGVKGIDITPYADIYATVLYGTNPSSIRARRDESIRVSCPLSGLSFTDIYIYSASQIKSVGDLSPFKPDAVEFSKATHLQELKVGDADSNYSNGNLKSLRLGNNTLLKKLDARNCVNLGTDDQKTVDVSRCASIEEVYLDGTQVRGVSLPNGGNLKKLHLPETVTNITVLNQRNVTEFVHEGSDYSDVTTLWIENSSSTIPVRTILDDMAAGSSVRLIGIAWEAEDAEEILDILAAFDTMSGLDESGGSMDHAQVSGTIHTDTLSASDNEEIAEAKANYPYITITADNSEATLTYKSWDGGSTLKTVTCINGVPQDTAPSGPTRTSTAQYSYTFVGWATRTDAQANDEDATTNVLTNRTVYAAYSRTVRTYTVTFVRDSEDGGGTLLTLTGRAYGSTIRTSDYTGATPTTTKGSATDYPFIGWNPSLPATVTGAMTIKAVFGSPVVVEEITDSWDTIIANIDNGTYKTVYKIGNYKPLDLGTEGVINMQIVAMDADVDANDDTVPLTFIGVELGAVNHSTSGNTTPYYDWATSPLRTSLNSTVLNAISSNVRNRITSVKKTFYKAYTGSGRTLDYAYDKLWIPSIREFNQGVNGTIEPSGARYSVFFANNNRRIKTAIGESTTLIYTTRSSYYNGYYRTYRINAEGQASGDGAPVGHIPIGFCLGYEPETITDDWATILNNADYATDYSIGDTKYLDLGTEGKQLMEIVAFDTDDKADNSGKAKITWISKNVLNSKSATGSGGNYSWENSSLRSKLQNDILPLVPSEVESAIVPVKKISSSTNGSIVVDGTTTTDSLWVPGHHELFSDSTICETTGAVYTYCNSYDKRKKHMTSPNDWGYPCYWLRSGYGNKIVRTVGMNTGNTYDNGSSTHQTTNNYICIGFCTD